jgi:hypothetical protein
MSRASRPSLVRVVAARLTSFALVSLALACSADTPTSADASRSLDHGVLAKASGNPTVSSASPNASSQGTTLDVHVFGTGFTSGAAATWQLGGVENPNKIKTNSTTVVSATELVANITIADTADVASWDVQVALAGGKKGIGTELFAVTAKGPPTNLTGTGHSGARWEFATLGTTIDGAGVVTLMPAGIIGDGRDTDGILFGTAPTDPFVGTVSGAYQNAHCGLALPIYWWGSFSGSGDATLDSTLSAPSSCSTRTYQVNLGATPVAVYQFVNTRQVMQLGLGSSRRQIMWFRMNLPNCYRLAFGAVAADGLTVTSGGVRVTRVAGTPPTSHVLTQTPGYVPGEWVVESVDGNATCENQKGTRWVPAASYTGLYFRIHITEIPPTL